MLPRPALLIPALLWLGAGPRPVEGRFVSSEGVVLRYRAWPPPAGERPAGVLLFFPWDGGGAAYARAGALRAPIAAARGLWLVSVRQPEGRCWWAPAVEEGARAVGELVDRELVGAWGIDPGRVFTTGLSGGADFAAALHHHAGFRFGGGAVALCGGDVPRLDGGSCRFELDPPEAPVRPPPPGALPVRYDFAITADDPLRPASERAAALYRELGVAGVRHRIVPGAGHCGFEEGFDGLGLLAEGLERVDPAGAEVR